MKKYEEDHYKYENIRKSIYPVIKSRLYDAKALVILFFFIELPYYPLNSKHRDTKEQI